MSTIAYAGLTNRREEATPGTSFTSASPGVRSYVDALAALVPAEVLTLHAIILSFTTSTQIDTRGQSATLITDPGTLGWTFAGLIVLSIVFYVTPRFGRWERLDLVRALIPPSAFVAWTMLQRATAFDAVYPSLRPGARSAIALFAAVVLGVVAAGLASKADKKVVTRPVRF